jgi:hypothetical protein
LYPHERSLAKTFKDSPFVIIGVNSDRDKNKLNSRIKKGKIPSFGTPAGMLRSFWDGRITDLNPYGYNGILTRQWQISSWPTVCIIDHEGIIRYATRNFDIKTTPAWKSLGTTTFLKDENLMVPIIENLLKKVPKTYNRYHSYPILPN